MAAKALEIHPALEEVKAALTWYLEHSETAAKNLLPSWTEL
jgi:hypothetical protein